MRRALVFAVVVASVKAFDTSHKIKESVVPPRAWVKQLPAPPDHNLQLRIGLPQPNFSILEEHLYRVSDPYHTQYGQHLSKEQVEDLVAPSAESVHLVCEWLASHGFVEGDIIRSPARDWATINVSVGLAEKMLNTVRLHPSLMKMVSS